MTAKLSFALRLWNNGREAPFNWKIYRSGAQRRCIIYAKFD